jgi:hypothetical protein
VAARDEGDRTMIGNPAITMIRHGESARAEMQRILDDQFDDIARLALERSTTIGAAEYGDRAWHKTHDELLQEALEEFADALFYLSVREDIA